MLIIDQSDIGDDRISEQTNGAMKVMSLSKALIRGLEAGNVATRKVLERIPNDTFDWTPHEKSMALRSRASHVADIPGWVAFTLKQDVLEAENSPTPTDAANATELVAYFDNHSAPPKTALQKCGHRNAEEEMTDENE